MDFSIRDINSNDHNEIDLVVNRSMQTVLETIPEFEGKSENALKIWPNFTFDQMKDMFVKNYGNPEHRTILVVDNDSQKVAGHAICSVKKDDNNDKYGFCFSRFIHFDYRQKGLATSLLKEQEKWWKQQGVKYILAQTHETNFKLRGLK